MQRLMLDFESFSELDLKLVGSYRYAFHPSTKPILCAYKLLGETEVNIWQEGEPVPAIFYAADRYYAHNAVFDYLIAVMTDVFPERMHDITKWVDVMALTAKYGYPLALDKAAKALGTKVRKGDKKYIKMFCSPTKYNKDSHPDFWEKFKNYAKQDVLTMEEILNKLPAKRLSESNQALWELTQKINFNGLPVDLLEVVMLNNAAEAYKLERYKRLPVLTGDVVTKATQTKRIKDWVIAQGVDISGVGEPVIAPLLAEADNLPDNVREVLQIRLDSGATSTRKFETIIQMYHNERVHMNVVQFGATTGRYAGRGFQLHNLPRAATDEPDALLDMFRLEPEKIGNPLNEAKKLIRSVIKAPEGMNLCVADWSGIETHILFWMVMDYGVLELLRRRDDLYKHMASGLYKVPVPEVTKPQRQLGKVAILGCIAEGELVLTDQGLVPIENVSIDMRVWDGVEWVNHDGVIYKGKKEVITYDGLTATPDHIVFKEDGSTCQFGEASDKGYRLADGEYGGFAFRFMGGDIHKTAKKRKTNKGLLQMYTVPEGTVGGSMEPPTWEIEQVFRLYGERQSSIKFITTAWKTLRCYCFTMLKSLKSSLQALRWERNKKPVQESEGLHPLRGAGTTSRGLHWGGDRQDRQRGALREGEPPSCNEEGTNGEQEDNKVHPIQGGENTCSGRLSRSEGSRSNDTILAANDWKSSEKEKTYCRANNRPISQHAKLQTKRTYDITNAGLRHRFTVSGKIVHNCGYGMGKERFQGSAASFGIKLTIAKSERVVKAYRTKYPLVVQGWYALDNAAKQAICNPGMVVPALRCGFRYTGTSLWLTLPSGRRLHYPECTLEDGEIQYSTINSVTKQWQRNKIYGGMFMENICQAVALDILNEALLRVDAAGFEIIGHVHDEIMTLVKDGVLRDGYLDYLIQLMCQPPEWGKNLPLFAEGYVGERYRK